MFRKKKKSGFPAVHLKLLHFFPKRELIYFIQLTVAVLQLFGVLLVFKLAFIKAL